MVLLKIGVEVGTKTSANPKFDIHLLCQLTKYRGSHLRCSIKIGALKNFANFTEKRFCRSLFCDNVAEKVL